MERLTNSCLIINNSDLSEHHDHEEPTKNAATSINQLKAAADAVKSIIEKHFEPVYKDVNDIRWSELSTAMASCMKSSQGTNYIRMSEILLRITVEHFQALLKFINDSEAIITAKEGSWEKEKLLMKKRYFSFCKVLDEIIQAFKVIPAMDPTDLYLEPKTSEKWTELAKIVTVVEPASREQCTSSSFVRHIKSMALYACLGKEAQMLPKTELQMDIVMEKYLKCTDPLKEKAFEFLDKIDQKARDNCDDIGFNFLVRSKHYQNNKRKCLVDGQFMVSQADNKLLRKVFNFVDKSFVKWVRRNFEYPSIAHNFKMYLKPDILDRFFYDTKRRPITLKESQILLNEQELLPLDLTDKREDAIRVRFLCDIKLKDLDSRLKTTKNKRDGKSSPTKPSDKGSLNSPSKSSCSPTNSNFTLVASDCETSQEWLSDPEKAVFKNVLIYFHGGGFNAMSSSSHQNYLVRWAKELKIPIFAIDYRKAPVVQYPELVNDCLRSYVWLMAFMTDVLHVNPSKIVVSGDSAGGNLAAVLTTWCIENNIRVPDHITMSYPAGSLDGERFTPSLVHAFGGFLLNYNGLRMCNDFYLPAWATPKTDYYLSPIVTPASIFAKFPPSEVLICERDPLCDDGFRIASKLREANPGNVKAYYFKHVIHGQLNFALSNDEGLPEAHKFEQLTRDLIAQAMNVPIASLLPNKQ